MSNFVVTWVFTYDECEISEGLCWQTIGVSPPMYFEIWYLISIFNRLSFQVDFQV